MNVSHAKNAMSRWLLFLLKTYTVIGLCWLFVPWPRHLNAGAGLSFVGFGYLACFLVFLVTALVQALRRSLSAALASAAFAVLALSIGYYFIVHLISA